MGAQIMRAAGFSQRVIEISDSVAHADFGEMERILEKANSEITDEEKAKLVMHYVDDVTINADWAQPAREVDGEMRNALMIRLLKMQIIRN